MKINEKGEKWVEKYFIKSLLSELGIRAMIESRLLRCHSRETCPRAGGERESRDQQPIPPGFLPEFIPMEIGAGMTNRKKGNLVFGSSKKPLKMSGKYPYFFLNGFNSDSNVIRQNTEPLQQIGPGQK